MITGFAIILENTLITGFAIILEDQMLYCSNESKFTSFEIIMFVEKLIESLNPKHTWLLDSIFLEGYRMGKERIVIKHIYTEDFQNLFFCVGGDFKPNSHAAYQLLEEFYIKVNEYYNSPELIKKAAEKPIFKEIIEVATDYLWDKYEDILEEENNIKYSSSEDIKNNILYCGISFQGLPIVSHVYSKILLENIGKEITEENVELLSSSLSAKLATIAMNTVIRAKTSIKEIHIEDLEQQKGKKLIFFGEINSYTLDFFASGDYIILKKIFQKLKDKLSKESVLQEEFDGDLKKYRYLNDKIFEFYQEGF
ncbi:MAG: hypothetical protein ACTSPW_02150 [Promethearchaeota archaeon]